MVEMRRLYMVSRSYRDKVCTPVEIILPRDQPAVTLVCCLCFDPSAVEGGVELRLGYSLTVPYKGELKLRLGCRLTVINRGFRSKCRNVKKEWGMFKGVTDDVVSLLLNVH
jgi:hypothetical protein